MGSRSRNRVISALLMSSLAACASEGTGSSAPSSRSSAERTAAAAADAATAIPPRAGPSRVATTATDAPSIPQYRRVAPPPGFTEDELGMMGTLRLTGGCVTVTDRGAATVVPIFPIGSVRWREPGRVVSIGERDYRAGDEVQWSVLAANRDFVGTGVTGGGQVAVPDRCSGDRYVKVIL